MCRRAWRRLTLRIPTTANIAALALARLASAGLAGVAYRRASQIVRFFRIMFEYGVARGKG
jgi:hypothetical protein